MLLIILHHLHQSLTLPPLSQHPHLHLHQPLLYSLYSHSHSLLVLHYYFHHLEPLFLLQLLVFASLPPYSFVTPLPTLDQYLDPPQQIQWHFGPLEKLEWQHLN
eukprot:UN07013